MTWKWQDTVIVVLEEASQATTKVTLEGMAMSFGKG